MEIWLPRAQKCTTNFIKIFAHLTVFLQVLVTPMPTLRQFIQSQVHALPQSTMDNKDKFIRRLISVEITWNYGGNSVGVVGSWNNWQNM
jgi:hypothetical protein